MDQTAETEGEVIEPSEEVQQGAPEAQPEERPAEGEQPSVEPEEVTVTIGEESPPQEEERAPKWVQELRRENREKARRIKELEAKLQPVEKPLELGKKPSLEDHDFDADAYESALLQWHEARRKAEAAAEQRKAAEKAQADAWQQTLKGYGEAKQALPVKDFEEAEAALQEVMNVAQLGIILEGAKNAATVVYALGTHPEKAKELAAIKSPVKFAVAIADLERELKVNAKKTTPPPEKAVSGTARVSGVVDSTLEKLRAEAEKTGDRTKVVAYMMQKRKSS
jgi:hypothetical protein